MTGTELIAKERERQIKSEKYSSEHDDKYWGGQLGMAAACYAAWPQRIYSYEADHYDGTEHKFKDAWPFKKEFDKRLKFHDKYIKLLTMAGALCAAEIDRILRVEKKHEDYIASNDKAKKKD